jgi:hypothetical protein
MNALAMLPHSSLGTTISSCSASLLRRAVSGFDGLDAVEERLLASPGIEGVGIVEAVSPGVQGPMVGTRVVFVDTVTPYQGKGLTDLWLGDAPRITPDAILLTDHPLVPRKSGGLNGTMAPFSSCCLLAGVSEPKVFRGR